MSKDTIRFSILEDGTVSVETDQVSGQNHLSADELLKALEESLGGTVERKKRTRLGMSANLRTALENHTHDGHTHSH